MSENNLDSKLTDVLVDGTDTTELEDNLVRNEICKLKGLQNSLSMRVKKQISLDIHKECDALIAKVHLALWPQNDMETFAKVLEEHPEVLESQFGRCKDTLLIR